MKGITIFILLVIIECFSIGQCRVIQIPGDYPLIQSGINASITGDTILVQPGVYNQNIIFGGRNIVLASLYITTRDTAYITQTIINGNSTTTTVRFENAEDSTAILMGFSIRNGLSGNGGGIYCFGSSPRIYNNIVENNRAQNGAGVYLAYSHSCIANNIIRNNYATFEGGGIRCYFSSGSILGNVLYGDSSINGGGIALNNSTYLLKNNLLYDNKASSQTYSGSAIEADYNSNIIMQSNILYGNSGKKGAAVCSRNSSAVEVDNTVLWADKPDEIYFDGVSSVIATYSDISGYFVGEGNINDDPLYNSPYQGDYSLCQQSPCINMGNPSLLDPDSSRADIGIFNPVYSDCFLGQVVVVSITGSDSSGDGSTINPYRTIRHALQLSRSGDTIIAGNGRYMENLELRSKSIVISSNYIYTGDTSDMVSTIIDGDSITSTISYLRCGLPSALLGFTLTGGLNSNINVEKSRISIDHNIISNSYYLGINSSKSNLNINNNEIYGNLAGGIYVLSCTANVLNNVIRNNRSSWGGGLRADSSMVRITRNIIRNNYSINYGGGIYLHLTPGVIDHNIITNNEAYFKGGGITCYNASNATILNNTIASNLARDGGGVACLLHSNPAIINSILWDDSVRYTAVEIYVDTTSSPTVSFSDIMQGWVGIGNIVENPLFRNSQTGNYHLISADCDDWPDSPCIDAGNPQYIDSLLDCLHGLGTERSDLGAYGGGIFIGSGINENVVQMPEKYLLRQNYPNPFNGFTRINYFLPKPCHVVIDVYDILGKRVDQLIAKDQESGPHLVIWDANEFSSGIYFAKLQTLNNSCSIKMTIMK